jgi:hypothetical protein
MFDEVVLNKGDISRRRQGCRAMNEAFKVTAIRSAYPERSTNHHPHFDDK